MIFAWFFSLHLSTLGLFQDGKCHSDSVKPVVQLSGYVNVTAYDQNALCFRMASATLTVSSQWFGCLATSTWLLMIRMLFVSGWQVPLWQCQASGSAVWLRQRDCLWSACSDNGHCFQRTCFCCYWCFPQVLVFLRQWSLLWTCLW